MSLTMEDVLLRLDKIISIVISDIQEIIGVTQQELSTFDPKQPYPISVNDKFILDVYLCTLTSSLVSTAIESPFRKSKEEMIGLINSGMRAKDITDYQLTKVVKDETNNP